MNTNKGKEEGMRKRGGRERSADEHYPIVDEGRQKEVRGVTWCCSEV